MVTSGVDIIEITRVEESLARYGVRFLDRVFTPQEQASCAGRAASLAGRFAVKEAVAKALGTGIGDIRWTDVEVVVEAENGRPYLRLHHHAESLAAQLGVEEWSISISHTDSLAIGFAVAIGRRHNEVSHE
ncbi:MAG: holo-ACP synthase [Ardenticatenaceae bacterium]|nr:holo-ACP synthase [Ardenticatenaceae bacterium]MCB8987424.1 holo-ACP synthase [Ardenticatenaceae bacterium]